MPLWRKIFFWVLLTVYLTGCPLLIFYALGIIGQGQPLPVTQAGMIRISTLPPQARVYINHKPLCAQTPCLIRDVPPGHYRLVIRHDGYQTWARTIPVKAQQAVALDPLLLIPRVWPIQEMGQRFTDLIPLPWPGGFLLKQGPLLKDLMLCRTGTDGPPPRISPVFIADTPAAGQTRGTEDPDDRIQIGRASCRERV